jgi:hypothetical protein
MPVRYSKQIEKTGAAVGSVISIVRPDSYLEPELPKRTNGNGYFFSSSTPGVYTSGLAARRYSGYFGSTQSRTLDNVNYTDNLTSVEGPIYRTEFNSFFSGSGGIYNNSTWLIQGFFLPFATGVYTFYTTSDDASYLWVGNTAVSGYTRNNAIVNNGGVHPQTESSGTITLSAGIYYPIRVIYGNQNSPSSGNGTLLTISFSSSGSFSSIEESAAWNIGNNYPGWLECDGRTLNISDYGALYSVIGNTYGGTFGATFKLPDYRSKKICGTGKLNGNSGSSLSLSPTTSSTGSAGGGSDIAGSTGGFYTINTIRQLPENSEVTPINPLEPPNIGGNAIDTFSLGTFRSQGFSSVVDTVEPVLLGNVSFGIGPTREVTVSAVPPHFHFLTSVAAGSQTAASANPGPSIRPWYNFYQDATSTVKSFNRTRRPWPGNSSGGTFYAGGHVSEIGLSLSGTAIVPYGPPILTEEDYRETGGFYNDGDDVGVYLAFGSSAFNNLQPTRRATWTVDARQAETLNITAIAGNDRNGGERPDAVGESLKVFYSTNGSTYVEQGIILPSRDDSGLGGGNGGPYDVAYSSWISITPFPIPVAYRVSSLRIRFQQQSITQVGDWGPTTTGTGDEYDMFGISDIYISGGTPDNYVYDSETEPILLQRHSHMMFWEEPNQGDVVPSIVSTFGTGGGADLNYLTGSSNGLRSGSTATTIVPTNSSIGLSLTKNIGVVNDVGNNINPATVTLSDTSRISFDSAISLRLEASEEIVLLTPYFRSKYLMKAY